MQLRFSVDALLVWIVLVTAFVDDALASDGQIKLRDTSYHALLRRTTRSQAKQSANKPTSSKPQTVLTGDSGSSRSARKNAASSSSPSAEVGSKKRPRDDARAESRRQWAREHNKKMKETRIDNGDYNKWIADRSATEMKRRAGFTSQQREAMNARNREMRKQRQENMTEEQREAAKARNRAAQKRFKDRKKAEKQFGEQQRGAGRVSTTQTENKTQRKPAKPKDSSRSPSGVTPLQPLQSSDTPSARPRSRQRLTAKPLSETSASPSPASESSQSKTPSISSDDSMPRNKPTTGIQGEVTSPRRSQSLQSPGKGDTPSSSAVVKKKAESSRSPSPIARPGSRENSLDLATAGLITKAQLYRTPSWEKLT